MLKKPIIPDKPTVAEIKALRSAANEYSMQQAKTILMDRYHAKKKEIIIRYIDCAETFDELKIGVLAILEEL